MSCSLFSMRNAVPAFALAAAMFAASANAEIIDVFYHPVLGASLDYRAMYGVDAAGDSIDLAGATILSSTLEVSFKPGRGADESLLHIDMVVPTSSPNQYFAVDGPDLTLGADGAYTYSLTTDEYNGTIYDGGFSVDAYGVNANGDIVPLKGTLSADTGYRYTVDTAPVPEPASIALMLAGLAVVPVVVRRRRQPAA